MVACYVWVLVRLRQITWQLTQNCQANGRQRTTCIVITLSTCIDIWADADSWQRVPRDAASRTRRRRLFTTHFPLGRLFTVSLHTLHRCGRCQYIAKTRRFADLRTGTTQIVALIRKDLKALSYQPACLEERLPFSVAYFRATKPSLSLFTLDV